MNVSLYISYFDTTVSFNKFLWYYLIRNKKILFIAPLFQK